MDRIIEYIPDLVKSAIHQLGEDAEVILFGSRARGDFDTDSDWDFLILIQEELTSDKEELIRNALYDIELATGEVITSIIEKKSEWEKYDQTLIFKNIEEEGIPVSILPAL
jgi:predicted nucleotidyltransferase